MNGLSFGFINISIAQIPHGQAEYLGKVKWFADLRTGNCFHPWYVPRQLKVTAARQCRWHTAATCHSNVMYCFHASKRTVDEKLNCEVLFLCLFLEGVGLRSAPSKCPVRGHGGSWGIGENWSR